MKMLFLGDVVGPKGMQAVERDLPVLIRQFKPDFVMVNGENAHVRNGITKEEAERLHYAGADIITGGNHSFRQKNIYDFLDECNYLLRPANFSPLAPGRGSALVQTPVGNILVINLCGQVYMENSDNAFFAADKILKDTRADFIFVDFHAEATSEKKALAYYLDGRVTGLFGTHTHVQTADEQFLPKGTAYITDVGMCGVQDSALGVDAEIIIRKFTTGMPCYFEKADGPYRTNAIFMDTEKKEIQRICT